MAIAVSSVTGRLVTVLAALGTVAALAGCGGAENSNGTGLTFEDRFYLLSSAEVDEEHLDDLIAEDVAFQDTVATLRRIEGVDPHVALAALVTGAGGTPAEDRSAWLLMSPDGDLAADPWSDPELAAVVVPAASAGG